ncbi:MAG: DUF3854 domain-containing protein [Actinomycetota bacterium]|nr:DUF3854 domain-containing protein [Actinomycetota bacterium]
MESYQGRGASRLSEDHRRVLVEGSGIAPEVLERYCVRTIGRGRELPRGFSRRQRSRAPGMLFEVVRPNGEIGYSFRPDQPDPDSPGRKYEQPCKAYGAVGNFLGVYETSPGLLGDPSVPLYFVEGHKKALSMVSAYGAAGIPLVAVAISGVWNWLSEGAPIPDMVGLPLEGGRECAVVFDSDMLRKPGVQGAAGRLSEYLIGRGTRVRVAYLSDDASGSKTGADDFFAGGGTVEELEGLMRPYHPDDFASVRLERDEELAAALEALEARYWGASWGSMAGGTDRGVFGVLVRAARRHGKVVEGGIRVVKSWGDLIIEGAVSRQTLRKSLVRLERRELLVKDNEGRKAGEAGAFVLRARVDQYGTQGGEGEKATGVLRGWHPTGLHQRDSRREYLKREGKWDELEATLEMPALPPTKGIAFRVPPLRWSAPPSGGRLGLVRDTRMVRAGVRSTRFYGQKRLGKLCGAILDVLDAHRGAATVGEIGSSLGLKRPCDFARRHFPVLVGAGLISWEGRGKKKVARLIEGWLIRLREIREDSGEIEADDLARRRVERQREAYRNRNRNAPDHHHANLDADGWVEDLERLEDASAPIGPSVDAAPDVSPPPSLSPLARSLGDYLSKHPDDACQTPYWLSRTLWAYDLYPDKPELVEVSEALEELGGEAYRLRLMRGDRGTPRDASCPLLWTSHGGKRTPLGGGYMGWFPSSLSRGARAPLERGEGSSLRAASPEGLMRVRTPTREDRKSERRADHGRQATGLRGGKRG